MVARRTGGKSPLPLGDLVGEIPALLERMQDEMRGAAVERREAHSHRGLAKQEFVELMEGPGGFVYGGHCGDDACERSIQEATKATVRVLPEEEFRSADAPATCLWCDAPATVEAVWAKAY